MKLVVNIKTLWKLFKHQWTSLLFIPVGEEDEKKNQFNCVMFSAVVCIAYINFSNIRNFFSRFFTSHVGWEERRTQSKFFETSARVCEWMTARKKYTTWAWFSCFSSLLASATTATPHVFRCIRAKHNFRLALSLSADSLFMFPALNTCRKLRNTRSF